jgi:nucleotidyltransferase substrate binding protein (TIGR01987 family)
MNENQDFRWKQRFQNFEKAVHLLNEFPSLDLDRLSILEKEGMIQCFEFTLELAWKTLKDKMEDDGVILDRISPKMVVKEAFRAKYISNVEAWLAMINDRNILTRTYDVNKFEGVLYNIQEVHTETIFLLYLSLKEQ